MTRNNWSDAGIRATLDQIDRAQRMLKVSIFGAALFELAGLLGMVLTVDIGDRTHRVLIAMTVLIYGTLSLGLVALGVFLSRNSLRILKAVELAAADSPEKR